jgi:hypothetical protein
MLSPSPSPAPYRLSSLSEVRTFPLSALLTAATFQSYLKQNKAKLGTNLYRQACEKRQILLELAYVVAEMGGWQKVTALNKWPYVDKFLMKPFETGARREYQTLLLPIEKGKELELRYENRENPAKIALQKLDFDCLQGISVVFPPENNQTDAFFWENINKHAIVILRGFTTELWPVNNDLFTITNIANTHGNAQCQVWKQVSEPECTPNQILLGTLASQKLKTFLEEGKNTTDLEAESAIGINMTNWQSQIEELRRNLPKKVLFGSEFDVLQYTNSKIAGITRPQLAIRSAGSWKGAYIETFSRVFMNHGPGSIQIWAIDPSSVPKMLQIYRSQLKIDLLACERYLWPDENYLISQNCPLLTGEILPGDLVLLQTGVMHWERSWEGEVSCMWGLVGRDVREIKRVFEGNGRNWREGKQGLVDIYGISMRLLDEEMTDLPLELVDYLYLKLNRRYQREKTLVSGLTLQEQSSTQQFLQCSSCKQELFYAYLLCNDCPNCQFCPFCLQSLKQLPNTLILPLLPLRDL